MIIFWLLAIVMTLLTVGCLIKPLLIMSKKNNVTLSSSPVAWYKHQIAALEFDYKNQQLTSSQFEQAKHELEHDLLTAVKIFKQDKHTKTTYFSRVVAFSLLLIIPVAAIVVYLQEGSSQQLARFYQLQQQAQIAQNLRMQLGTPQQVIIALQHHLADYPASAQGWYLLGRIYLSQNQFTQANSCFAKAYALQPTNRQFMYDYAQTLYLQTHSLDGLANTLLQKILVQDPKNELAINLLAIGAFQAKHYQQAVGYWESLLPQNKPDTVDGRSLLKAIATAQALAASTLVSDTGKRPTKP